MKEDGVTKRRNGASGFALCLMLGALLLGLVRTAEAQWVTDGVRASALAGVQGRPASVSDGAGGVIIAWQNGTDSSANIQAQRLSASGEPLWGPDGVPVCTADSMQYGPVITAADSGGVIIAWTDLRAGRGNVYAQRLNVFGDPMWTANGVSLTGAAGLQRATAIVTNGWGEAVVVWDDYRSGTSDIYGRQIDASGNPGWAANGVAICTALGHQRDAVLASVSGTGVVAVAWEDSRGPDLNIYAQEVSRAGTVSWPANGAAVCAAPGDQSSLTIASPFAGYACFAWNDRRGSSADIYTQLMNSAGVPQWAANGVVVCSTSGDQTSPHFAFDDPLDILVAAWDDANSDAGDVYAQRLNIYSGAPMWPASGVALCAVAGRQDRCAAVAIGEGRTLVAWTDRRVGTDIYAQAIDSTGAVSFATNGVALCSASAGQDSVALIAAGTGGAVIAAWTDARLGTQVLYAQRLSSDGRPGFDHTIATTAGAGGKIVPGGDVLENNTTQTFLMAPNAYSRVQDVLVDGVSVGAPSSHSIPFVTADHTLSATFATNAASAYAGWIPDGVPVTTGFGAQDLSSMVPDGVGGVVLAWRDSRTPANGKDIYAQRFNPSGRPMWAAGGVPVCTASRDQSNAQIASDGAGGAIIVWDEPNRGSGAGSDVYAQRLDAGGVVGWIANGIAIATSGNTEQSPVVASDGAGGGVVAWIDWRSGQGRVYGQRVAVSGAERWTAGGIRLALDEGNDDLPRAVPDGEGGAIVGWTNFPDSVFVARVDSAGVAQWQTIPNAVPADVSSGVWRIVQDIRGGALASWKESGTNALRIQRISHTGVKAWTPSPPGITGSSSSTESIASDGEGGAFVSWGWFSGNPAVSCEHISPSGGLLWGPSGTYVATSVGPSFPRTKVTSNGAGGAIVAWVDARGGGFEINIYARSVSAGGVAEGPSNGVPVCVATGEQSSPLIVSSGGSAVLAWTDRRPDSSVFVQRVNDVLAVGFDHVITSGSLLGGAVSPSGSIGVFDGTSHTFTVTPSPGFHVANLIVDGQSVGPLSAYTFFALGADHTITAIFSNAPVISRIEPDRGGAGGKVSVVVTGSGFVSGATVKLLGTMPLDIVGTLVTVAADSLSLSATLDLVGRAPATMNVSVTNPNLSSAVLTNGFTIEAADPRVLRVDVVGSPFMRPDRRRPYDIVIENLSNVDLYFVPLWISRIPAAATVDTGFTIALPPRDGGEPDWSQVPLTLTGPAGRYLPLLIPLVPPGVTVRRLFLTVPETVASFDLDAALTPPWQDGLAFRSCVAGSGAITAPACMGAQLAAIDAYLAATPAIKTLSGIALWAKIAWQCEGAANLPAALTIAEQVLDFMLQPVEQPSSPAGCEISLAPRWQDRLAIAVVTSIDPNDKLGSSGSGPSRLIGAEQILPYSIRFENIAGATGPVQYVVVTDVLDVAKLDLATLSLGPIQFGRRANGHPWTMDPGSGLTGFTAYLDLLPEQDLIVRVWANLDAASGVLGWSLTALDRQTMELPDDPLVGFLPRNVTPGAGEGSLLFSVMPKAGLSDGTVIRNRATINFDGRSAQTPEWTNTMDVTPPESAVLPLAPNQDLASFTVQWQVINSPLDLKNFSVYVSMDGGTYQPWRVQTTATVDTIIRPGGHTYSFYSQAQDLAGNVEPVPPPPYVQTFSRVAVDEAAAWTLSLEGALPNPTTTAPRVWFTLPSRERAVLEVMDVAGRRLLRRDVGAMGVGRHSVDVSAAARRPGLYFLRLAQGDRTLRARMVVIR